ncbi:MAG: bifunctional YncE family protein/alkaline phosphatase family protein, partial [Sediminibacterium sp.]
MRYCFLFLILGSTFYTSKAQEPKLIPILEVPGKFEYARVQEKGVSVLPSGRYISPAGEMIRITHDPFGMRISPDGKKAVTLHNGIFTIIDIETMRPTRVPSYDGKIASPFSKGSFLGVDFGKTSNIVYLSGGDNGAVLVYDINSLKRLDSISLNGKVGTELFDDSFTSDLLFNEEKNELLVLDRANYRLVRINLTNKQIEASIPCGRLPFGLSVSSDKRYAFVANVGMYAYPLIEGMTEKNYDSLVIPHHPYGDNTKESINGTIIDGKKIPGVGSPLSPEAMSVFVIDLNTNKVLRKLKTGHQIGELIEDIEVVGGASPNSIAVGKKYAYITNATNDNISVIDYSTQKIVRHIPIKVSATIDQFRGLLPFGITLSKDEKKLFVALLGFNAVAVIDVETNKTIGLIPTGWGPSRVMLGKDEQELYIITARGLGAGPNGGAGFKKPIQGTFISDLQLGSFHKVAMPDSAQLAKYTATALSNTFFRSTVALNQNPLPPLPGIYESPIKHIVYITKENRTYDEVFGQIKEAKGDSTLARFGVNNAYTLLANQRERFKGLKVTPNHHKIARQFSFSDNFYCDSDASIHGHHWMM